MANPIRVETIILNKGQTAILGREGSNGAGVVSGSVSEIAGVVAKYHNVGCQIIFDMSHAPSYKRHWNAMVKRARRIADEAGVVLAEPVEYFIGGYRQTDRFVMEVIEAK